LEPRRRRTGAASVHARVYIAGRSAVEQEPCLGVFFLFNPPAPAQIYTLSLHDALPISRLANSVGGQGVCRRAQSRQRPLRDHFRSEEHTSELQSLRHLVCRLLLEKKKNPHLPSPQTALPQPRPRSLPHACTPVPSPPPR